MEEVPQTFAFQMMFCLLEGGDISSEATTDSVQSITALARVPLDRKV